MNREILVRVYPIGTIISIFIINLLTLSGFFSYAFSVLFYTLIGISGYYIIKKYNMLIVDRRIILISIISGSLQIIVSIFLAFFTGFGTSPYLSSWLSVVNNLLFFSTNIFGVELLRYFILKNLQIRNKINLIIFVSIIITLVSVPLLKITSIDTPLAAFTYIGSQLLPSLSQNGLSTLLAITGGPLASIAYRWTITAFEWLSPILPDLPWILQTVSGVALPILGLYIFTESLSPQVLARHGLIDRNELRTRRSKGREDLGWIIALVFSILMVWGSMGMLGFKPMVVLSGSMIPTFNVGDIAITVNTPSTELNEGDIISYYSEDISAPIIHRIERIYDKSGETYIVTKGDANNAEDSEISVSSREILKTAFVIPKIGLASIFIKESGQTVTDFIKNNTVTSTVTICITVICVIFTYHIYINQPGVRLRRRLGR